jgi:hypothetical protein
MVRKLGKPFRVLAYLDDFLIFPVNAGSQYKVFPEGGTSVRKAALIVRLDSASDEGEWVGSN